MHEIRVDIDKNRLYFTLGMINQGDELAEIIHKVQQASYKLSRGFTCITDLRHYELAEGISENFMRLCQEALWDCAIGRVVRVKAPERRAPDFPHEHKSLVWPAYSVDSALSMEEAENLLDQPL
ncbi:hypothetical protein [Desulfoluna sp.]|uniref:hypothetical protein n=1 Tax=Desulfoluna sp. TaxID=2045199 RepID=UPI002616066D|nr:hypothetical protein [Desulfoluna sp.]